MRGYWLGDSDGPAQDALPAIGAEQGRPRYQAETLDAYATRLEGIWQDAPQWGAFQPMIDEFAAAGYAGAAVKTATDWPSIPGPDGSPGGADGWWSQFWVTFPSTTTVARGITNGVAWGAYTWGAFAWSIGGLSQHEIQELQQIAKRFSPAHWCCREILFYPAGGLVWGSGVWGTDAWVDRPARIVVTPNR